MLREILIIALLVAPATAWEIQNRTVNMTENELFEFQDISHSAGIAWSLGQSASEMYAKRLVSYGSFYAAIETSNKAIRKYNKMIETHFNDTVYEELRIMEYSI